MALFKKQDREVVGIGAAIFGLIAVLLAFSALVVAADARKNSGSAASGTTVTLTEFAISPQMINAPVDGKLNVTNAGTMEHNLAVTGTDIRTKMLKPGESETLSLKGLEAKSYNVLCEVAGHSASGMTGMLHVGSSGGAATAAATANSSENDAQDAVMKKPVDAYVAQLKNGPNTKGVGNTKLDPVILPDGTKQFNLKASVIDWEVSPGKTVKAWAYNDQVPGPWIRVEPGDRVEVNLDNQLPQSTAIHYHGIETPNAMDGVPDVTQAPVKPGEKFSYTFVAKGPAYGMYHSHHHAEHQVPDGLVGVFQVGDPPLPRGESTPTQQIPMVLNDAGVIGLSLNGKSFPATAPVMAKVGETVEITYLNEGAQIHPMHLHGMPQTVIGKDGFPVPQPYEVDTVTVAPGERWTVLVKPTADFLGENGQPGVWAYHCHILNHAEGADGMFGMVTTFIVTP